MRDAVVVEAGRTAVGKRGGGLSEVHPADLSADVLNAVVERAGIDPGLVDDVVWGCVSQVGDQSSNIGRFAVLAAGWPDSIPGVTINRACGSSQQALDYVAHAVMTGHYDLAIAGGVEVMSRVPLGAARTTGLPYCPRVLERWRHKPHARVVEAGRPLGLIVGARQYTDCGAVFGHGPRRPHGFLEVGACACMANPCLLQCVDHLEHGVRPEIEAVIVGYRNGLDAGSLEHGNVLAIGAEMKCLVG